MIRLVRAILLTVSLLAIAVGPAMASTTSSFVGVFRESFGRGNAASGVGYVTGLGQATESFTLLSHTRDGDCWLDPGVTVITFQTGTVSLLEENRLCTPGGSGFTPGGQVSYGNPVLWTGTYTIVGGTGAYAGATGTGTTSGAIAGDVISIRYAGTIILP
jgi:hypothetical protein